MKLIMKSLNARNCMMENPVFCNNKIHEDENTANSSLK